MDAKQEREMDRALDFHRCPQCSYDFVSRTGSKACHLYECPYLPTILDVSCPRCNYNFETCEGNSDCSDPPTCEFARSEAPRRVEALHRWIDSEQAG
jgi:hypothetical protein